jgi:tRNA A-37 threonylcarbamoyl transferase component Bud32/uncharacterized protein with WD repeat
MIHTVFTVRRSCPEKIMIGTTLGAYRIQEQIGMGGMATVYKAYDPGTDRHVAIKILPKRYSENPEFRERFRHEAKSTAKLEHPYILPVYVYGEQDETAYLVMRYLAGGTLAELVRERPLGLDEVARLVSQIGSALEHAHQNGIVHRDVKPSNVLLDGQGNAFLGDFGIAKMLEGMGDLTRTGTVLGTPYYLSPERCRGRTDLTAASDIYSLGVMVYEMVTGQVPFNADTPLAIVHKHLQESPPPPRHLRPNLPEEVERVLLTALAKRPEDRYESAGALAGALARAVGTPLAAELPPVSTGGTTLDMQLTESWRKPPKRRLRPVWIGMAVLVIAAGLAGGILLTRGGQEAEEIISSPTITDDPRVRVLGSYPGDGLMSVAWSPDGTRLASGALDGEITVWDVTTGDMLQANEEHALGVSGMAWSPDGRLIASSSTDARVIIWDPSTGEPVVEPVSPGESVWAVAWSPDGTLLASGSHTGSVDLWNTATGELVASLEAHTRPVGSVAWSPDGTLLASASRDGSVIVWDAVKGEPLRTFSEGVVELLSVAWSPDGERLAAGARDQTITVWDAETGARELKLAGGTGEVDGVAWSPDGARLATVSNEVNVRDGDSGYLLEILELNVPVTCAAWSPDSGTMAVGLTNGMLLLWDPGPES